MALGRVPGRGEVHQVDGEGMHPGLRAQRVPVSERAPITPRPRGGQKAWGNGGRRGQKG